MKSMFASEEAFTAYATISAGFFMLKEISVEIEKLRESQKKRSRIEQMVDQATGYDKDIDQTIIEYIDRSIEIIREIIKNKEIIEEDTSGSKKMIKHLKRMKSTLT